MELHFKKIVSIEDKHLPKGRPWFLVYNCLQTSRKLAVPALTLDLRSNSKHWPNIEAPALYRYTGPASRQNYFQLPITLRIPRSPTPIRVYRALADGNERRGLSALLGRPSCSGNYVGGDAPLFYTSSAPGNRHVYVRWQATGSFYGGSEASRGSAGKERSG